MAAWTAAARRIVLSHNSVSTPQFASLKHRRGLAGGADLRAEVIDELGSTNHHGPPKVNFWEDPFNPSRWKGEHFVIVSLTGWGLVLYGAYDFFTKGKKEEFHESITSFSPICCVGVSLPTFHRDTATK
uniref:Uncharacterized protein n=1 Tax=Cucumis melo TaxID=3656 RepID=A0A9I9EDW0_CUCME